MKRWMLSLVMLVVALGAVAEAQVQPMPNMFPTMAACSAALESGAFRFYEPKYFGLRTKNPVNGIDRVVVPLESNLCLEMLVVGGHRFVAQREGTLFRAHRLADGSLSLYARDDCGNPVYGVVFPAPAVFEEIRTPISPPRIPHQRVEPVRQKPRRVRTHHSVAPVEKKSGFCSSKKCKWTLVAIGGAAVGSVAYYYWPCPAGTVRK